MDEREAAVLHLIGEVLAALLDKEVVPFGLIDEEATHIRVGLHAPFGLYFFSIVLFPNRERIRPARLIIGRVFFRAVIVGTGKIPVFMGMPGIFVDHQLAAGFPRFKDHFVAILVMGAVSFVLELSNDLVPPLPPHDPTGPLHGHGFLDWLQIVARRFYSGKLPNTVADAYDFELHKINRRNVHNLPFHRVQEIPPGCDNPVGLAIPGQDNVEAGAKRTMLVCPHDIFTRGNRDTGVYSPAHAAILPEMQEPHPFIIGERCFGPIAIQNRNDFYLSLGIFKE